MAMLYYVHDPMCSWCWSFDPVRRELLDGLPENVTVRRLLGGLAPDTDQPMPDAMRTTLQATWRRIQQSIPGTEFNFGFWSDCRPRRSTWPACRAVIAARSQAAGFDEVMTRAVQKAYYLQARNPSDDTTLVELAVEIGLQEQVFSEALTAEATQQILLDEMAEARRLQVDSFPGLALQVDDSVWRIPVDYLNSQPMLDLIRQLIID